MKKRKTSENKLREHIVKKYGEHVVKSRGYDLCYSIELVLVVPKNKKRVNGKKRSR